VRGRGRRRPWQLVMSISHFLIKECSFTRS
jgi:hypothetical protein